MSDDEDGPPNPTLQANFVRLNNGRSVARLRADMKARGVSIGANAIQLASAGSTGLRLRTLQKFADFFGCSVSELVEGGGPEGSGVWPFPDVDQAKVQALSRQTIDKLGGALLLAAAQLKVDISAEVLGELQDPLPIAARAGKK